MSYTLVAAVFGIVPALMVPLLMRLFVDRYLVAGDATWIVPVVVGLVGPPSLQPAWCGCSTPSFRRSFLRLSSMDQVGFAWHLLRMRVSDLTSFSPATSSPGWQRVNGSPSRAGCCCRWRPSTSSMPSLRRSPAHPRRLDVRTTMAIGLLTFGASLLVLLVRDRKQVRADESLAALSGTTSDTIGAIESVKAAAWGAVRVRPVESRRQRMAWSSPISGSQISGWC